MQDKSETALLGQRIRDVRKAKGLSLQKLSNQCGLSVSYLSQIERNNFSPSIGAVHKIAKALDVGFTFFFSGDPHIIDEEKDYVVRSERRWSLSWDEKMADQLLSPNLGRQLQLLYSTFQPGADSGDAPYSHKGEKAGVVLQGVFELWVGERRFILNAGDSFAFDSEEPHRYRNPSDEITQLVWVITPPKL